MFSFVCRPCVKLNPSITGTNVFVFLKNKNEREVSFIIPYCKETISLFPEADDDTDIDSVSLSVHNTSHSCHTINKQMYFHVKNDNKNTTQGPMALQNKGIVCYISVWYMARKIQGLRMICKLNKAPPYLFGKLFHSRNCNKLSSQQY